MEHPQKRHPFLWEIHGSAEVLLLWLQVLSPYLFIFFIFTHVWFHLMQYCVFVAGMSFPKPPTCTSYLGWTCSSCSPRTACLSSTRSSRDWVHETFRPTCTSGTRCPWSRCQHLFLDIAELCNRLWCYWVIVKQWLYAPNGLLCCWLLQSDYMQNHVFIINV